VPGISVRVVVIVDVHVDLGRPEDSLHDLAALEGETGQPELGELRPQRFEGHPRVDQSAHDHVARGSARTVEIGDAHGQRILLASLLIWFAWAAAP
jgi:hypothetical protein